MHIELSSSDWVSIISGFVGTLVGAVIAWFLTKMAIKQSGLDLQAAAKQILEEQRTLPTATANAAQINSVSSAIIALLPLAANTVLKHATNNNSQQQKALKETNPAAG
jgi:H+/gluconate symporter-like permease